ncbi:hypothetical protein [Alishewanella longhuensis]
MKKREFSKIYTGDYSKEGYDAGMIDRKSGHPKNKLKVLKTLHPVNYVWQFDNAFVSFSQNYDAGYLDAQRVDNEVFNDTRSTGKGTMTIDSYERHIGALEDFRRNLLALKRHTTNIKEQYAKQLLAMENAGFVQNITQPLQNKYQLFSNKLDQIDVLIDEHNRKITTQKEALEQLAQMARNNP